MLKTTTAEIEDSTMTLQIQHFLSKLAKLAAFIGNIRILSEDSVYKWQFIHHFMPELYKKHTSELYANCIFCDNLVRSRCHQHCLKCTVGTYIHCSPLMPGILHNEPVHPINMDNLPVPWYYMEPCSNFKRLPQNRYFRNLHVPVRSIDICNFEVLEGLEQGLAAGERPCHVCASVNYALYLKCLKQSDFSMNTPCHKIASELCSIYQNQS